MQIFSEQESIEHAVVVPGNRLLDEVSLTFVKEEGARVIHRTFEENAVATGILEPVFCLG